MSAPARDATRQLVVNADDLGQSDAINAGIIDAVEHGIVTSASAMVRWQACADAAAWARGRSALSIGLHVDLGEWIVRGGEWQPVYEVVDTSDAGAVGDELDRQLALFVELFGRPPSHLDSHQHVHMREPVRSLVVAAARRFGAHVRGLSATSYCGEFYGQWGKGEPYPDGVSVEALLSILDRLPAGTTELACHPGADGVDDIESMYLIERGLERRALCDPKVREAVTRGGIDLRPFDGRDGIG